MEVENDSGRVGVKGPLFALLEGVDGHQSDMVVVAMYVCIDTVQ